MQTEKALSWLIAVGSAAVTCLVWSAGVTDPVNAPKLFLLGAVATGVFAIVLKFGLQALWIEFKIPLIFSIGFIFFLFSSSFFSEAPFVQTFYGAYGRNTGVAAYIFLTILFLGALALKDRKSHEKILGAFFIAGVLNIVYCLWVLAFGDPIPWNNTYKRILGLLGNPNFISSFLGMVIAASTGLLLDSKRAYRKKFFIIFLALLSMFLIYKSSSIQGIFVAIAGVSLALFFLIRSRFNNGVQITYLFFVTVGFIALIFGMLQKGPFSFIYKKSVSLRGSYWNAGLNMGQEHPLTGIGMDTYGDWYRGARPPVALIDTPGPTVLSNAAHNVTIDIFASGGYPLLITYLGIFLLAAKSALNLIRIQKKYDPISVVLTVVWVGYVAQSIISINQIGLAIWGWVCCGLLISYERIIKRELTEHSGTQTSERNAKRLRQKEQIISPQLVAGIGILIGAILAVPPVSSDSKWFQASQARDLSTFKESLQSSYLNPLNSARLANASLILQNSNFVDEARKYALMGIDFNPNYFESYFMLYNLPNSSEEEKIFAMSNMKRIDPNNPDILKLR